MLNQQKFIVIVCVDDERIVLESLRRELNDVLDNECLIETAESGEEAVEIFQELLRNEQEIPLVIADYIMPDMKGDELLQRIHEMSPKTLKIMLTGQADVSAVTNAVNFANLYRYIAKPWEATDLVLTVKEALRRYFQDQKLEEQNQLLQNMNAILEQQVKERTAELEHANASKDKFFSIIAHDLRRPFTGLLGLIELFLERIEDFSREEIKESLFSLQTTSKSVYTLLENLLTWSRMQRGIIEHVPQNVKVYEMVEFSFMLLKYDAEQKQIALQNLIDREIMAYADFNMINTVLRNLLSNAIKFTKRGGQIQVSATSQDGMIEMAVADTGLGIKEDDLSKLFRIDIKYTNIGTAGENGSGLGLILCKELVKYNGGSIWVESKVNVGSTFKFTLPKPFVES